MNLYQGANSTLSFAVVGACVAGLNNWLSDTSNVGDPIVLFRDHVPLLGLWGFIIALKIKFWLDDHHHFGEAVQEKLPIRIVGFILAVFSMIFLGLAGYQIRNPIYSAELIVVSILISTAWVIVHLFEITLDKERRVTEVYVSLMREKWALINIIYCLILAAFIGWFKPAMDPGNGIAVVALFVVLLFDWVTSRQTAQETLKKVA
jgi:hypothetical protein